jgi:hypothetical protein
VNTRPLVRLVALAALGAALVVPAAALAALPKAGGNYGDCTASRCKVSTLKVSADAKRVVRFSAYTKCNHVPIAKPFAFPITAAGTFSYAGSHKDVLGKTLKVEVTGKFVSATEVRGSFRISSGSCDSKPIAYRALLGKGSTF